MGNGLNAAFSNNETVEGVLQCNAGFTYIDFLPRIIKCPANCVACENFGTVVDRANEFLQNNRKWNIVTCESVQFTSKGNKDSSFEMACLKNGHSYVRGLRLWLTERNEEKERKQQIGYVNLIPEQLEKGQKWTGLDLKKSMQKNPSELENLATVIERFNSKIKHNPLPGRIITIQTEAVMIDDTSSYPDFDPDSSHWIYCKSNVYITILRIFYDTMTTSSEEIGIKDFAPDMCYGEDVEFEPCGSNSITLDRASYWCTQQQNFRFCNAQTLYMDWRFVYFFEGGRRMGYLSDNNQHSDVRILRVAYTRSSAVEEKSPLLTMVTSINFETIQLIKSRCKNCQCHCIESFLATRKRISAWVKNSGVRVLSAETNTYPIGHYDKVNKGTETSCSHKTSKICECWLFVIRLYLDGIYEELPTEISLEVPKTVSENNCCHASQAES